MKPENHIMNDASSMVSKAAAPSRWSFRPGRQHVLALLLFVMSVALFWPATKNPFMMIDDGEYVTDHALVTQGLTWTGVGYAFVARHSGNWHPLTTISHMVDCELFGVDPSGHHIGNILLHGLNAALLFWLLWTLTGAMWRSFFVAGFFGLHPLRVESVAWISERKDVLCAFFYLLTLWAYSRYAQERSRLASCPRGEVSAKSRNSFYTLSLVFFALALLSKPMAVTLPFALLLFDFWPLGRLADADLRFWRSSGQRFLWPLLREKIPFFALTLVDAYITTQVQSHAMAELQALPVAGRLANMFLSYSQYISKTFLPKFLAIVYPYHYATFANGDVIFSVILIGALSMAAWHWRKRMPWLLMGWLWFLGTLIPVIGLVQVGIQSWADRYTYLPCIGLAVIAVWLLAGLTEKRSSVPADESKGATFGSYSLHPFWLTIFLGCAAVSSMGALAIKTRVQLSYWRTNEELMDHALSTAGDSELVRHCIGYLALNHGQYEEAARQFRAGLNLEGDAVTSILGLAAAYKAQGKDDRAEHLYRKALELEPSALIHFQLADFLAGKGRIDEAQIHYLQGLASTSYHAPARIALGNIYAKQGNWAAAREQFENALKLNPNLAGAHLGLAGVSSANGQDAQTVFHLREAMRLASGWAEPINNLAWRLATHPKPTERNGPEALHLARRAVELTKTNDFEMLDTLAAAYAQNGSFKEAIATAHQALDLALKGGNTNELSSLSNHLALYESGKPCCGF